MGSSIFGLDDGHDSLLCRFRSSSAALTRVQGLVQQVVSALTPASLSDGDEVKVTVANDNRITVKTTDTGTPYVYFRHRTINFYDRTNLWYC